MDNREFERNGNPPHSADKPVLTVDQLVHLYEQCAVDSAIAIPWIAWERTNPHAWRLGRAVVVSRDSYAGCLPEGLRDSEVYAFGPTLNWRTITDQAGLMLLDWVRKQHHPAGWYGGAIYGSRAYVEERKNCWDAALAGEIFACVVQFMLQPICAPGLNRVRDVFRLELPDGVEIAE